MGLRHRRWYDRGTALRSGGMASMMSLSGPPTLKSSTSSIKESEVVANDQERIMVLNLAPKLLRYLLARTDTRAASESLPTLLVKMFGMFHVRFSQRNTDMSTLTDDTSSFVSGRSSGNPGVDMEMTLVVSENLYFGGASFSERYDLKGIRARCIAAANSPTAALDEVLERLALSTGSRPPSPTLPGTNVVDDRQSSPTLLDREWLENNRDNSATMFLSPEAKFHLHQALINDTDFLTSANIVDYSLLIGVDRDKRRLR